MREDLERLKKIRLHRGLRTYWGLRVRGQHTKTTGRRGKTVSRRSLALSFTVADPLRLPSYPGRCLEEEVNSLLFILCWFGAKSSAVSHICQVPNFQSESE